jgi:ABC-type phosphate/phosphonate transport system substrate-binding protein
MHAVADISGQRVFFGGVKETGSHANSIRAVASETADIAAIDCVTWRLADAHQAEAKNLRVLTKTAPAPGLPYIAALGFDAESIAQAVANGIAALDEQTKSKLGLRGFVRTRQGDYDVIQVRAEEVATISPAHGLASFSQGRSLDSP